MINFRRIIPFVTASVIVLSMAGCGAKPQSGAASSGVSAASSAASSVSSAKFPKFTGTDFDGNAVDESIFSENAVTVLNLWFNGCTACVDEMPDLEKFNEQLKEKGAQIVGVNVEAPGSAAALEEAKSILEKQGATYRNIMIDNGGEADEFMGNIMAFPTTFLVDRNGNIIGEPYEGTIDGEQRMAQILQQVDQAVAAENAAK